MASATITEPLVAPPVVNGDEALYEIIDGQRVELPPMSAYATRIASRLGRKIGDFAEAQDLGESVIEGLFHLPLPLDRNRRCDAAFVSYQRWPKGQPIPEADNAWDVVPDLAVEVVSPNDLAEELLEKIKDYFQAGVRVVWVVYPRQRTAHVYESFTQIRVLGSTGDFDGGDVMPGFRLPLAELF